MLAPIGYPITALRRRLNHRTSCATGQDAILNAAKVTQLICQQNSAYDHDDRNHDNHHGRSPTLIVHPCIT